MQATIERADWELRRHDLLAVRHAVFVREQGVPIELEQDEHDAVALHLLARDAQGRPVATARLLPDGHIGRMAVLAPWRGKGLGTAMLRQLLQIAASRGIRNLVLNAQCVAEPFYRRLGFEPRGSVFKEAGIDHRRMTMHLGADER